MRNAAALLILTATAVMSANSASSESVTFAKDVGPIVHAKCTMCHRDGQAGPFELITYEQVRQHAGTIQAVVHENYMPPWKLTNTNLKFANDRRLTDKEKELINSWVENEMPAGDLDSLELPQFESGWALGKPDLVLKMKAGFDVPADGPDVYRTFVFENPLTDQKWVKAIELRPSARGVVHHALFFLDESGQAALQDGADGKPGIEGMSFVSGGNRGNRGGGFTAFGGLKGFGGYVPGATPNELPGDLARLLPAGADIVMQTHFHPSGKAETEQSELALYFADKPPKQQFAGIMLPPLFGRFAGLDVAAGEKEFEISRSFTLPIDVQAVSIGGHAHYIASNMDMVAKLPDGTEITLLKIDDWDLDWQDQYQFAEPLSLPAGTVLTGRVAYDNSADNPENPFSPPQRIKWGRESTDEMGSVSLTVVAKYESERPTLEAATRQMFIEDATKWRVQSAGARRPAARVQRGRADMMTFLDKNGDGKLQHDEVPGAFRDRLFAVADKNADQVLDEDEMVTARKLMQRFRR